MASWGVAQAKAKFSEVLDKADVAPQRIERRKKRYILIAEEQYANHGAAKTKGKAALPAAGKRTMAEFFRNSPLRDLGDVEFERIDLSPRHIDF